MEHKQDNVKEKHKIKKRLRNEEKYLKTKLITNERRRKDSKSYWNRNNNVKPVKQKVEIVSVNEERQREREAVG